MKQPRQYSMTFEYIDHNLKDKRRSKVVEVNDVPNGTQIIGHVKEFIGECLTLKRCDAERMVLTIEQR